MKRSLKFALGLIACLAILMALISSLLQNVLEVINQSGQSIESLTVSVGGKTYTFTDIPSGSSVSSRFSINGDGDFEIHALLADHSTCDGNKGYVTNGLYGDRHVIRLKPRGRLEYEVLD